VRTDGIVLLRCEKNLFYVCMYVYMYACMDGIVSLLRSEKNFLYVCMYACMDGSALFRCEENLMYVWYVCMYAWTT
jgi:hypothetical protein